MLLTDHVVQMGKLSEVAERLDGASELIRIELPASAELADPCERAKSVEYGYCKAQFDKWTNKWVS